jgi:hypothetical protein
MQSMLIDEIVTDGVCSTTASGSGRPESDHQLGGYGVTVVDLDALTLGPHANLGRVRPILQAVRINQLI